MKVAVGSKNPVKIAAAKQAFESVWPKDKWEVVGVNVESGVSEQPMSDAESIKGATTRAKRAIKKLHADFGVGQEGGLQKIGKQWFDSGWMVVIDKNGVLGIGSTARMLTPERFMKLIRKGVELGHVSDKIFGKENSKQGTGHFGLMTNNLITREHGHRDGLIMALSRFIKPEVFE